MTDQIELLRFATAGSVDDGKSTLIGRLLFDSKSLFEDQLEALERDFDLSKLTDGLRAEREQGITIDVAHRYFATPRRRFVIADCPGHLEYTRNAVTGMSSADLVLLLIDARHGVVEQTRRHLYLASNLRIPEVVVCINKLDLLGFDPEVFERLARELLDLGRELDLASVRVVPISALHGDNVASRSERTPFYAGPSLLELLETVPIAGAEGEGKARFPVQLVLRPARSSGAEGRRYAGQLASGSLFVGQEITVLPSGRTTRIAGIEGGEGPLSSARAPMSVALRLLDELDVSRGDLIVPKDDLPAVARALEVTVSWMSPRPLRAGELFLTKLGSRKLRARVEAVLHRVNLETLEIEPAAEGLAANDIGRVRLSVLEPVAVERHREHRALGRLVLVDPVTKETAGAGLVEAFSAIEERA